VTVQVTPQVAGGAWALASVKIITLRSDINTGTYF
jgi:hypothetical protein